MSKVLLQHMSDIGQVVNRCGPDEMLYLLQRLELQASAAMADGMCDHSEMSAEDC